MITNAYVHIKNVHIYSFTCNLSVYEVGLGYTMQYIINFMSHIILKNPLKKNN